MSYRDEQDRPYTPPARAGSPPFEPDEDFVSGGNPAGGSPPRRSGLQSLLRGLLIVLLLLVVIAGGLIAAVQFRLVDPATVGLSGLLGGSPAGTGTGPNGPSVPPDVIFAGDTELLATTPGNTVQPDQSASIAWLRTTVKSASAAGATDGITVVIPKELLPRFEGRRVRVTISARSGSEGAPIPFAAAYSAGPKGNSNWIVFVPEKEFTDHSFSFVVPIGDMEGSNDHRVAIWSDIEGKGVPLGVRSITIQPD